jgi:ankyrin repeat protein
MKSNQKIARFLSYVDDGNIEKASKMLTSGKLKFDECGDYGDNVVSRIIAQKNKRAFDILKNVGCKFTGSAQRYEYVDYLAYAAYHDFDGAFDYMLENNLGYRDMDLEQAAAYAAKSPFISVKKLKTLVEKSGNVNSTDIYGQTALMLACGLGRIETVEALIEMGADATMKTPDGKTALHMLMDFVKRRDVDLVVFEKIVDKLIECGLDINVEDNEGNVPLKYLAGNLEGAKILLDRGADPLRANNQGGTPLLEAAKEKYDCFRTMVDFVSDDSQIENLNNVDQYNYSIAHYLQPGQPDFNQIVEKLTGFGLDLNKRGNSGYSPLHRLSFNDNEEQLSFFLSKGADPFVRDDNGKSFLVYTIENRNDRFVDICIDNFPADFSRSKVSKLIETLENSYYSERYQGSIRKLEMKLKQTGWISGFSSENDMCIAHAENNTILGERIINVFNFVTGERYTKFEPLNLSKKDDKTFVQIRQPVIEVFNERANREFWRQAAQELAKSVTGQKKESLQRYMTSNETSPAKDKSSVSLLRKGQS